jgi:hypothetical protein
MWKIQRRSCPLGDTAVGSDAPERPGGRQTGGTDGEQQPCEGADEEGHGAETQEEAVEGALGVGLGDKSG